MAEELRKSNELYQRYLTAFLKFMEKAKVRRQPHCLRALLCGPWGEGEGGAVLCGSREGSRCKITQGGGCSWQVALDLTEITFLSSEHINNYIL